MDGDAAIRRATEEATAWLLNTGYRNILVDVMNEFRTGDRLLESQNIHQLIEIVQHTTVQKRRLLASSSRVDYEEMLPAGHWQEIQDFYLPHGNPFWAEDFRHQLQYIKASET